MNRNGIETATPTMRAIEQEQWETFQLQIVHFLPQEQSDIELAFRGAQAAHRGQQRKSLEPFFTHPLATTQILLDAGVKDVRAIVLGLYHDVQEETRFFKRLDSNEVGGRDSWQILSRAYSNEEIAFGLHALTEPDSEAYSFTKKQADAIYHEQLALSELWILLVKMADRIHNILTLGSMPPEKQQKKIEETRTIYLPLFERVVREYPSEGWKLMERLDLAIADWEEVFQNG